MTIPNPAEQAAGKALSAMYACIDMRKNFLIEAGAGAGKTDSLVKALQYIIKNERAKLLRQHQKIACITYTNVATDEITSRTDRDPVVLSSTIHAFCWSLIKNFQPILREYLPNYGKWREKLEEAGETGTRSVEYDLGHPKVEDNRILLGHDDVLSLAVELMKYEKFRMLITARYPILFIDEYQDTNKDLAQALINYFINSSTGPLIGFFGDHWQKIYGDGYGKIEHSKLELINRGANFRSVQSVVDILNRIRPELPQEVRDPTADGFVSVFHTNRWHGERLSGQHWDGDLPPDEARRYLELLKERLSSEGWSFDPEKTKILMLTHKVLAAEQGYSKLASIFPYNDAFIKKEDPYIAFLVDTLEPVCEAYRNKHFGKMFELVGRRAPAIGSVDDKNSWAKDMNGLIELCSTSTIGEVLDYLNRTKRPRLPEAIEQKEHALEQMVAGQETDDKSLKRLQELRKISYNEVIALSQYLDGHTPFSTKHGVKGAEFENVLVVFGRGWNQYNFNQFLEWVSTGVPDGKQDAFERNRNLFYVVCSRPQKRLSLLFTQKLSHQALKTLEDWFGMGAIHSL